VLCFFLGDRGRTPKNDHSWVIITSRGHERSERLTLGQVVRKTEYVDPINVGSCGRSAMLTIGDQDIHFGGGSTGLELGVEWSSERDFF
jgi:hypothetical protein